MTRTPHGWLRVGGRFELAGWVTTWSVAEGRRGRRWRTVTLDPGGSMRAMLLEVDPDGRATRLELATPRGLVSMHPEDEPAVMHGNIIEESGVRPISLPWGAGHLLAVDAEPVSVVVALGGLGGDPRPPTEVPVLVVDPSLTVEARTWRIERTAAAAWRIGREGDGQAPLLVVLDRDGLPRAIDGVPIDACRWPLEDG